jgi:hypothetical protein
MALTKDVLVPPRGVMALTTGCNGTALQESIFCCILQTNKQTNKQMKDLVLWRLQIRNQSVAFTDSESIRDNQSLLDRGWIQSIKIPAQRNVAETPSRGCVTSRLGQHHPTEHPGDMLRIMEAPASNPDHMSCISCCRLSFPGITAPLLLPILVVLEFVFLNCVYVYGHTTFAVDRVSLNKLKT